MNKFAARLFIPVEGNDKSYMLWNGTEVYYEKLRSAYTDIINNQKSDYLFFGFFTLCAATLEYSLNFLLTNYCLDNFGHEKYKPYAEGYISMPFPKKLLMTPSIISNGALVFNEDTPTFKTLRELITLRNRLLHNKEFLKEIDFPSLAENADKEHLEFQLIIEPNYIDTLTKELCVKFGIALGEFKNLLMDSFLKNELTENSILIKAKE